MKKNAFALILAMAAGAAAVAGPSNSEIYEALKEMATETKNANLSEFANTTYCAKSGSRFAQITNVSSKSITIKYGSQFGAKFFTMNLEFIGDQKQDGRQEVESENGIKLKSSYVLAGNAAMTGQEGGPAVVMVMNDAQGRGLIALPGLEEGVLDSKNCKK